MSPPSILGAGKARQSHSVWGFPHQTFGISAKSDVEIKGVGGHGEDDGENKEKYVKKADSLVEGVRTPMGEDTLLRGKSKRDHTPGQSLPATGEGKRRIKDLGLLLGGESEFHDKRMGDNHM